MYMYERMYRCAAIIQRRRILCWERERTRKRILMKLNNAETETRECHSRVLKDAERSISSGRSSKEIFRTIFFKTCVCCSKTTGTTTSEAPNAYILFLDVRHNDDARSTISSLCLFPGSSIATRLFRSASKRERKNRRDIGTTQKW